MGEQRLAMRQPFGFDEELVESRMRAIGLVRRQSELEVTGQFETARFAGDIDQSHAPDLGVVFCGDRQFR